MSFFGYDTTLPRDRGQQQNRAPGFSQHQDAFADLSGRGAAEEEALDFEDTYDGLANQLDETGDDFNDDTFGTGPSVGRDFDFSGKTDNVSRAIEEERMRYAATQPAPRVTYEQPKKPRASGYEPYSNENYIPQLEADASLWGIPTKKTPEPAAHQRQQSQQKAPRKGMTLEEVEAALRAEAQQQQAPRQQQPAPVPTPQQLPNFNFPQMPPQQYQTSQPTPSPGQPLSYAHPPQILQRPHQQGPPQQHVPQQPLPQQPRQAELPGQGIQQPQILQRQQGQQRQQQQPPSAQRGPPVQQQQQQAPARDSPQPRHILQNPNRLSGHGQPMAAPPQQQQHMHRMQNFPPMGPGGPHQRGPSYNGPPPVIHLTEEDKAAYMEAEARRAKRNHKIHLLSKDNGLMTPQDKNFITRIQLQQLVTATGNVDDQGPEAALSEDFYYQVYAQIRGASRRDPHQPASQFAHTYLFQTGGRYGMRRNMRHGDNHMQRMEQQVQRAVEAAKAKPKNKQLVIAGSLGKISFSNAKTPKPLLNIKRPEGEVRPNSAQKRPSRSHDAAANDRRSALRNIESVYDTLMRMEDHERQAPPRLTDDSDPKAIQYHMEWREELRKLNEKLWHNLRVLEPIIPNSPSPHPFIAILSHPKGKKAIPRVFRHLEEEQRLTVITMIAVHLDQLDVIVHSLPSLDSAAPTPVAVREEIDLFAQAVMPSLFSYVNDAPLNIIVGLIGLIVERTTIPVIVRTKIGLSILTMLISRAEILRQTLGASIEAGEWDQWLQLYNRLFDATEPILPVIFPGTVVDADDFHVWQFLAAMGVASSPDQQQRLVIGVKERVMETVGVSRGLPKEMGDARLGHVNLFMKAIGLDVELLG